MWHGHDHVHNQRHWPADLHNTTPAPLSFRRPTNAYLSRTASVHKRATPHSPWARQRIPAPPRPLASRDRLVRRRPRIWAPAVLCGSRQAGRNASQRPPPPFLPVRGGFGRGAKMHETRVAHSERAPAALYAQLNRRQSLRSRVGRPIRFGGRCESR